MPDFLRDSIWQSLGVIVSCICGITPIIISILFFILEKRRKSLSYEVLAESSLISIRDEVKKHLQILLNGIVVQDASLVLFRVKNDGNVAITSSDFEMPIVFSFGEDATIIEMEIYEIQPQTLKPQISIKSNSLEIAPLLLNKRDTFSVKVIVTQYKGITAQARIVGVNELKQKADIALNIQIIPVLVFSSLLGMACSLYSNIVLAIFDQSQATPKPYAVIFSNSLNNFFIASGIIAILLAYSVFWFYRERKNNLNKAKR